MTSTALGPPGSVRSAAAIASHSSPRPMSLGGTQRSSRIAATPAARLGGSTDERTRRRRESYGMGIPPAVRVGHVHLKVADLDRALAFYRDALGFAVSADAREHGLGMVMLAAGDYHHHLGLNTFESAGATAPPAGHTGLYHVAFLYPD